MDFSDFSSHMPVEISAGAHFGNNNVLKLSGLDHFEIRNCRFLNGSTGGSGADMVGCHYGVFESNVFENQGSNCIQAKGGSSDLAIRNSRFEHAGDRAVHLGGSTGLEFFRPEPQGFEARAITVERCTFVGSEAPIAFVGVDGATVRFNTFYQPRKWVARILQETTAAEFVPCRAGRFCDNLIAYRARDVSVFLNIGPHTAPDTFEFARNYWYCMDDEQRGPPKLPILERDARGGANPKFEDESAGKFTLAADSPARAHGASAGL